MTLRDQARKSLGEARTLYQMAGRRGPATRESALAELVAEVELMDDLRLSPAAIGAAILFAHVLRHRELGAPAAPETPGGPDPGATAPPDTQRPAGHPPPGAN